MTCTSSTGIGEKLKVCWYTDCADENAKDEDRSHVVSPSSPSEYPLGTVFCAGLNFRREIYSFGKGGARAVGVDGQAPTPHAAPAHGKSPGPARWWHPEALK